MYWVLIGLIHEIDAYVSYEVCFYYCLNVLKDDMLVENKTFPSYLSIYIPPKSKLYIYIYTKHH